MGEVVEFPSPLEHSTSYRQRVEEEQKRQTQIEETCRALSQLLNFLYNKYEIIREDVDKALKSQ